jgi:CheY-like chemotaxis protein
MKILIADDNSNMRSFIIKLISPLVSGAEIYECADGEEAIEIFQEKHPDMILMDIRMERMDGLTAIRKIHSLAPNSKAIIVSHLPENEFRSASLEAGALDYVNKENLWQLPGVMEKILTTA